MSSKMMRLQISGRLLTRNTLLNFVGQAGPLVVAAATIPLIIRGLGVERFGLLSIAWVAPEYFTFIDLGLGRATLKYAAEALGKGEKDRVLQLVWTAATVQVFMGFLGTLGLISMTAFLTQHILNIPLSLEAEAKATFYLLALSIPMVLVSSSLNGVLAAAQRFDLVNAVGASFNISSFVLTLVGVVYFDWHLSEIVTMLVVSRFLTLIINYWLCVRVFPALGGLPRFRFAELRTLLAFGGWVTVSSAAVPILLYLDRFVIGASLTMAAVAYYSVPYEIVTRLWIIPMSLVATLFPAFSVLAAQEQRERLTVLLVRSMKWILVAMGPAIVIIAAFAHDVLQVWLGTEFARESTPVLQILAVGILLSSMVQVQYALIQALGRPDLTAKFHAIQLPIHALLLWWLVGAWGITGAAVAQAIRLGLEAVLLFFASSRFVSLPFYSLLSTKIIQSWLLLLLLVGFVIWISSLPVTMWLRLVILSVIFWTGGITVWRYSFDRQDRDHLAKLFSPTSVP
jgi:O-antigen/teichoic acid export membrane protein